MATDGVGGGVGGDCWERAQGRKDQRCRRVVEAMKEAYEEVEARWHRALAYDCRVPYL